MKEHEILEFETKGCFDYFWNEVSFSENGYGLIKDSTVSSWTHKDVSSIASTGFGFCAIVIGVERGYIGFCEGYSRVLKTLKNVYENASNTRGFFNHFLDMKTSKVVWNSEVSIIDTSIFIMGAMVCSEYFGQEVSYYFEKIYNKVEWEFFRNKTTNRFYMGYSDETNLHFGEWDNYAEQLMMYFLGVASPKYKVNGEMFYNFNRQKVNYGSEEFITSPFGSLFIHQFSHAFIDFRRKRDREGTNFFKNSQIATFLNRQFCIDNRYQYKTFGENSWGITPCETPSGYIGTLGVPPCLGFSTQDGTVAIYGAVASIVFLPDESIESMNYLYTTFKDKLFGKYGFKDSFNLDKEWFCDFEIGIDKGISMVMIENYRTNLIWDLVINNKYIKKAFEVLEFSAI